MRISTCRSCRAPVVWAVTSNGKAMPVDAEPSDEGNVLLTDGSIVGATVLGPLEVPAARAGGSDLHTSHFVTCPHADEHRRSR